jgi:hypothetical protein
MCGTTAPTAKNFDATAMPKRPVDSSPAMMDQVMTSLVLAVSTAGPDRRVRLTGNRKSGNYRKSL